MVADQMASNGTYPVHKPYISFSFGSPGGSGTGRGIGVAMVDTNQVAAWSWNPQYIGNSSNARWAGQIFTPDASLGFNWGYGNGVVINKSNNTIWDYATSGTSTFFDSSIRIPNIKTYSSGGQSIVVWNNTSKRLELTDGAIGGGTVTDLTAGNLSPLFTTSVATSTTTPALTFSLSNAAGGTVFGNNTSSSAAPAYTSTPVLGIAGTTKGTIGLAGNTSGTVTIQPAAAAGTWTLTLPTTGGTNNYVLTTNGSGTTTWTDVTTLAPGTVTSFSAGNLSPLFTTSVATSTSTPALTFSLSNAAGGTVFGNRTSSSAAPAYTSVPVLGIAGTTAGTLGLSGVTSGVVTIATADAAGTWTMKLPTTGGTSGYFLQTNGSGVTTWAAITGGLTRQIITSGSSGTVTGGNYIVTIDPASTLAAYTLTLPASPNDLDIVEVDFGGTVTSGTIVTALTISANTGQTILDNTPPVNATADNTLFYRYRSANTTWYRFKP
jgi:hypothetical protein